jgi:hypothetical protein
VFGCLPFCMIASITVWGCALSTKMSRDTLWQRRRNCAAAFDERVAVERVKDVAIGTSITIRRVPCVATKSTLTKHYNEAQDRCTDEEKASEAYCYIMRPAREPFKDCGQCRAIGKEMMTK